MNKNDFNKLNLSQKGDSVFSEGKHLAVRYYYNMAVNLYLLTDFYVEVFYNPELNEIIKIELLDQDKNLDLYIDHMNTLNKKNIP